MINRSDNSRYFLADRDYLADHEGNLLQQGEVPESGSAVLVAKEGTLVDEQTQLKYGFGPYGQGSRAEELYEEQLAQEMLMEERGDRRREAELKRAHPEQPDGLVRDVVEGYGTGKDQPFGPGKDSPPGIDSPVVAVGRVTEPARTRGKGRGRSEETEEGDED